MLPPREGSMYYATDVIQKNETNPWGHIFTTPHFLHNLQMGQNKQGLKGLEGTYTLA